MKSGTTAIPALVNLNSIREIDSRAALSGSSSMIIVVPNTAVQQVQDPQRRRRKPIDYQSCEVCPTCLLGNEVRLNSVSFGDYSSTIPAHQKSFSSDRGLRLA